MAEDTSKTQKIRQRSPESMAARAEVPDWLGIANSPQDLEAYLRKKNKNNPIK